jgi:hypothetical protein
MKKQDLRIELPSKFVRELVKLLAGKGETPTPLLVRELNASILALVMPLLQPDKLNEVLASLHTKMASGYQKQLKSSTSSVGAPAPAESATNGAPKTLPTEPTGNTGLTPSPNGTQSPEPNAVE